MNASATALWAAAISCAACSEQPHSSAVTASPPGWQCGATGAGSPKWAMEGDPTLGRPVIKQSGTAAYPWCVKPEINLTDGFAEVRFKSLSGKQDQAGGLVWRWQNGDNYYVARANALENNLSLYYTQNGTRHTIQYVDAPVAPLVWHDLRVEFKGTWIKVFLDGKRYIDTQDSHIGGGGSAGIWTKADSVTVFDEFNAGALLSTP